MTAVNDHSDLKSDILKCRAQMNYMRLKSVKRRKLLCQALGISDTKYLSASLGYAYDRLELEKRLKANQTKTFKQSALQQHLQKLPSGYNLTPSVTSIIDIGVGSADKSLSKWVPRGPLMDDEEDLGLIEDYFKVLKEEEARCHGETQPFLKGTQSMNPHNDYCQHFVDTGQRPQNFIRDSGLAERFEEYPKLKELIKLKDELVQSTATAPMYLRCDLQYFDLAELGCKFDAIIIEPPLEEYQRLGVSAGACWSWEMIQQLNIPAIADWRCFVWIWCGSGPEGLDAGRHCLRHWGFRRCEDICWIKTNAKSLSTRGYMDPKSLFQRTKEHCLMGIKGTVRRSVDGDFIHANVDIDLIISEEPEISSIVEKPSEIFLVAEHFCLGRRRLHIFGCDNTIRPGWLTIGPELTSSNFDSNVYKSWFDKEPGLTTGCTERIETLRPKSPPPKSAGGSSTAQQSTPTGSSIAISQISQSGEPPPPGVGPGPMTLSSLNSSTPSGMGAVSGVGRGRAGWGRFR